MISTNPTTNSTTEKPTMGNYPSFYYLKGSFNNWRTNKPLYYTRDSSVVSTTLQLDKGTHTFKINNGLLWYGNDGTIDNTTTKTSTGGWVMSTSAGDCTLTATGGYYTFNFNISSNKLILLYSETNSYETESFESTVLETADSSSSSETNTAITEFFEYSTTEITETNTQIFSVESTGTSPKITVTESVETLYENLSAESSSSESTPVEGKNYTLGDINADGNININDATLIQKHIALISNLTEIQSLVADVNKDGEVNISDVTEIQKYAAIIILSFGNLEEKSRVYDLGDEIDSLLKEVKNNLSLYYRYSSYMTATRH